MNPRDRINSTERAAKLRKTRSDIERMNVEEIQALAHELQVYRVELETQNEQLRNAELELAETRDRYVDLYDFAPVGYLTLDGAGTVLEANLAATTLLGAERGNLIRARLARFVARDSRTMMWGCRINWIRTGAWVCVSWTIGRGE